MDELFTNQSTARLQTNDYRQQTHSRNRIITMSAPGMTAAYPFDGKPKAFKYAVFFKRF